MPGRKKKIFNKPRKPYDKPRIEEENVLIKKYGLKNKREIWKADFAIGKIRNIAKKLIAADEEEKQAFIGRQKAHGFEVETIADVLGLDKEDYLKRRLQSVVVKKKLATTPNQARQFITHKHVTISGNILNSPSHLTTIEEENSIKLNITLPVKKELSKEEKEILAKTKIVAEEVPEEAEKVEETISAEKTKQEK